MQELKNSPSYSLHSSLSKVPPMIINDNSWNMDNSTKDNKVNVDCQTGAPLALCLNRIQKSVDLMAAEAERLFYDCEYKKCMKVLDE